MKRPAEQCGVPHPILGASQAGHSKIDQNGPLAFRSGLPEDYIFRFEVAMDNAAAMNPGQGGAEFAEDSRHAIRWQRPLRHLFSERRPRQEWHYQARLTGGT